MKIEKTFIISLAERLTDRLIPLIDYLKRNDFDYSVFSAIKKTNGEEGLLLSIKKLLEDCINAELSCVLILEDDVNFLCENVKEKINDCLSQLPSNFDLCYLGCNLWQTHVYKYSQNLVQLSDGYATHSIIYSRSGMQKVLNAINEMKGIVALDVLIKNEVLCDGNSFCSFPILASQVTGHSDIQGKIVNYEKFLQLRFAEKTAHLK